MPGYYKQKQSHEFIERGELCHESPLERDIKITIQAFPCPLAKCYLGVSQTSLKTLARGF